jgi:hypothetical protein
VPATTQAATHLPPPLQAAALMHAPPAEVQGRLGLPDLRRQESDALVWLYAPAPNCRVDIVFFPEAGEPRVAMATARVTPPLGETACLGLVAARAGS